MNQLLAVDCPEEDFEYAENPTWTEDFQPGPNTIVTRSKI
jgi:hypothetical protein